MRSRGRAQKSTGIFRLGFAAAVALLGLAASLSLVTARDLPSTLKSPLPSQGVCSGFYRDDFNNPYGIIPADQWNGDPNSAWWTSEFGDGAGISNGVLQLNLRRLPPASRGKEAAVTWTRWWQYGEVCASVKSGRGGGVVSALFIASYEPGETVDDEIDMEWVGKDQYTIQSNYFSKGRLLYGVNGQFHFTGVNAFDNFVTLCVERQPDHIKLSVNGNQVRWISASDLGSAFPNRPAKVVFDIWDAGTGVEPGVSDWAGGPTWWGDNNNPEFRMQVDWVTIRCDNPNGGSAPSSPSSGSGADIGGYCQASTFGWCKSGCCVNAQCADYSTCFGGSAPPSPSPSPPSSNLNSGSGADNGGFCQASTFTWCKSGCCINAACAPYEQCFGSSAPSAAGSSGAPNGAGCTASSYAQCGSGCCYNAICSDHAICFGGSINTSDALNGKPDGAVCSASGPECSSGCCLNAVCSSHASCFGN